MAARFANPCDAESVREAKSGFRRAGLALRPEPSRAVAPLPSTAAWSLALLATYSPRVLRHQLTAVVCAFWWMRRAKDLVRLSLADMDLPPDGRTCFIVRYHKTAAADGPISRELPWSDTLPALIAVVVLCFSYALPFPGLNPCLVLFALVDNMGTPS